MTSAIERAARAIATTLTPAYADPAIWAEDVEMYRRRYVRGVPGADNPISTARAAIAALREMLEEKK